MLVSSNNQCYEYTEIDNTNKTASVYLYLLSWPPCITSVLNIGGWSSLPGAEASIALGNVLIGLHATLYTIRQTSV